jgi:hypothetical protein
MKIMFLTATMLRLGVASAGASGEEKGGIAAAPLCTAIVADGQCNEMIPQVPAQFIREPTPNAPTVTAPAQHRRLPLLY